MQKLPSFPWMSQHYSWTVPVTPCPYLLSVFSCSIPLSL